MMYYILLTFPHMSFFFFFTKKCSIFTKINTCYILAVSKYIYNVIERVDEIARAS